ncbi:MAG: bifunctional DNA-formamidopyrimidine glycosylase/DNA-(apurinic or apyrimidinic site) lyase [Mariprofundaceae bacterium]
MPELPEVEVICRGLSPLLVNQKVSSVELMRKSLRFPLPDAMSERLSGLTFSYISRRSKYLLFHFNHGPILVWHLGMTGQFHLLDQHSPATTHEHVRIHLASGKSLCYRDVRRFGYAGIVNPEALGSHKWFRELGPEPLEEGFSADHLIDACSARKAPIKSLLMDSHLVVGVGNIYASESLFRSGIHPARAAGKISQKRLTKLRDVIREVLNEAIAAGGSTISDFVKADGKPGYFAHQFRVYGREGEPCFVCKKPIRRIVQSGRSTFYCLGCQH